MPKRDCKGSGISYFQVAKHIDTEKFWTLIINMLDFNSLGNRGRGSLVVNIIPI